MRLILLGLGGFLAAGGIVYAITGMPEFEARRAVAATLRDPSSAQFEDVHIAADGVTVCGYVNAKNGFGGYAGRRQFAYRGGLVPTGDVC